MVDAVPAELQPMPDTVALLRRLHAQGRRLHFLSNMPRPYAEHLEREHDFVGCFESGVFSARVQQIKPEREIFDIAARHFGADAGPTAVHRRRAGQRVGRPRRPAGRRCTSSNAADCEAQLRPAAGFEDRRSGATCDSSIRYTQLRAQTHWS